MDGAHVRIGKERSYLYAATDLDARGVPDAHLTTMTRSPFETMKFLAKTVRTCTNRSLVDGDPSYPWAHWMCGFPHEGEPAGRGPQSSGGTGSSSRGREEVPQRLSAGVVGAVGPGVDGNVGPLP